MSCWNIDWYQFGGFEDSSNRFEQSVEADLGAGLEVARVHFGVGEGRLQRAVLGELDIAAVLRTPTDHEA